MLTKSVLNPKYSEFEYYKNRLPQYLQQSDKFLSHFRIWFDLLKGNSNNEASGVVPSFDFMLYALNIFDSDYNNQMEEIGYDPDATDSQIIDQLGALFDLKRSFSFDDGNITLTNAEFIQLIKTQIIKNNCEGTSEQIHEFYKQSGLIIQQTTLGNGQASIGLIKNLSGFEITSNIESLFEKGLLTIESLGISYTRSIYDDTNFLVFDKNGQGWGIGKWA